MLKKLSAKVRITVGLVALLVSVLMLAVAIGLVPNTRDAIIEGRAKFCEAIAVSSSALAARGDIEALKATLSAFASRDKSIISAAVRQESGKFVAVYGDHEKAWGDADAATGDAKVFVPIFSKDERWGTVEVRFKQLTRSGILGFILRPSTLLCVFVAGVSFVLFLFYLKKVLQHLDPSKAVPGRVRSALDTLAEGLIVLDDNERIVLANQAFAAIAGRAPETLLGVRADTMQWIESGEATEKPWTKAIRDGEPQRNTMLQLRDSNNEIRTFVANCSPVQGHNGKYHGVLVSLEDVTVLERQKVELNKSKEAAEAANQAKSEFLARMSHEIRTPMNAILGFADVLRRGFEQSAAERQEYLETIHSSGQHLMELINDILDLSKIEAGRIQLELTQCSPHQIINEVVTVLRVRAQQKGIALNYRWDGPLPQQIKTDPTRLRQVLTNLIGNAIKFTDKGGVEVVTRIVPQGDSHKLDIDVVDTGIGISSDAVNNLFQPFMQADTSITRRFGGTGLGLVISRQLAEAMGGGIIVRSEQGKGSTFTCTIDPGPLDGVTMLQTIPTSSAARHVGADGMVAHLQPIRVLSVDDGASNQKLITLVLKRAGAAIVDQATNGRDGLDMALKGNYDIVLMDMQMPIMDGYTAVKELRKRGSKVPVVALTAHAMKTEEDKCLAAGCTSFLPKPIDVDRLVKIVVDLTGEAVGDAAISKAPAVKTVPSADSSKAQRVITSSLPTDDPDFREVVEEFVEKLDEQLRAMQTAWEQRELTRVASLAHWLKGSGGTAGFDAFTQPAKRLEALAGEERLDDVADAIAELQQLASQIQVAPENEEVSAAQVGGRKGKGL